MLKTRIVVGLGLVLILLMFMQQNFIWAINLHGIGEQKNLNAKSYADNTVFLVKAQQNKKQRSFIYRLSSIHNFKIPLWPFCQTIVSKDALGKVILLKNLINCDFKQVKILHPQDVNFFIDILIVSACLVIILLRVMLPAKALNNIEGEQY